MSQPLVDNLQKELEKHLKIGCHEGREVCIVCSLSEIRNKLNRYETALKKYAANETWFNPPADKQLDKRIEIRFTKTIVEMQEIAKEALK